MVAILEPFLFVNKYKQWAHFLHLPKFSHNNNVGGKVWLFWAEGVTFDLVSTSNQALTSCFLMKAFVCCLLLFMLLVSNCSVDLFGMISVKWM